MPIREIRYSPHFEGRYKRLRVVIKKRAKNKEPIFREDPFDSRLKTHKLHGKDKEHWAFWIDYHYRIKFTFLKDDQALFLDVGTHDEVY